MLIDWIQYQEKVVAKGHPTIPDVANRPLRSVLTASGTDPDGDFVGFSLVGHTHAFADLEALPTTLLGYGITDAYTKTAVDAELADVQAAIAAVDAKWADAANLTGGVLAGGRLSGSYTGITGVGELAVGSIVAGFGGAVFGGDVSVGSLTLAGGSLTATGAILTIGTNTANALILRTGGSDRWSIGTSGALVAVTDNSYPIGGASSGRPSHIFAAGTLNASGLALTAGGSDASTTATIGAGGPAPTGQRQATLTLNPPSSATWLGHPRLLMQRNGANVWALGSAPSMGGASVDNDALYFANTSGSVVAALRQGGELRLSSHLTFTTHNSADIGGAGANAPRNIYVGSSVRAQSGFYDKDVIRLGSTAAYTLLYNELGNFAQYISSTANYYDSTTHTFRGVGGTGTTETRVVGNATVGYSLVDASATLRIGAGGGAPTAVRGTVLQMNTPSAVGTIGTHIIDWLRNGARIWAQYTGTANSIAGADDLAWYPALGAPVAALTQSGSLTLVGNLKVGGAVGFNGVAPLAKPAVVGSRGGNAALASLLTALATYGLITDTTTA